MTYLSVPSPGKWISDISGRHFFRPCWRPFSAGKTFFCYFRQRQKVGSFSVWTFLHIYKKVWFFDVDRWIRVEKLVWKAWVPLRVDDTKSLSWKILGQHLVWQPLLGEHFLALFLLGGRHFFYFPKKYDFWNKNIPSQRVICRLLLTIFVQVSQCIFFCWGGYLYWN